jgi:hypothetical protein
MIFKTLVTVAVKTLPFFCNMPPLSQKSTDIGTKIALSVFQNEVTKFNCNFVFISRCTQIHKKNEMGWACGAYGEGRGVHRVLVGKP